MLSPREQNNYARALLNNASCLMPPSLHEALQRIPGGSPSLQRDCGWEPDNRLAVHLLQKASERGSLEAGWILSQFYLGSVDPELQDHRAAYLQLSRTGGLGHASARLMTGIMRWRGRRHPVECPGGISPAAAEGELTYEQVLQARDLAVDIHNGQY